MLLYLPESERDGVLGVRSPNFDDLGKLLGLRIERVVQLLQPRQEHRMDFHGGRNVHRRGKRVVGALLENLQKM